MSTTHFFPSVAEGWNRLHCGPLSATTRVHVAALRSFTGYLYQSGIMATDIADGIAGVRTWRLSSLPKGLEPDQVEAVLASCDRDTFRLLVNYANKALGKPPQDLSFEDLDADLIGDFLHHLEYERGNDVRTRNARLAAIRSLFGYVALHEPQHAALAQRVLAIPTKRYTRREVDFLNRAKIEALLRAPDRTAWVGRRDYCLLLVALQTGMRSSEIIALRRGDVRLGDGAHVRCHGKGRKERSIPLRRDSVTALRAWLKERGGESYDTVFPNQRGRPLSHGSFDYLLARNLAVARAACASLEDKRVTPHTLRHSAAMELLHNGVDRATIALWLGHESVETTYIYLHADLELKERAMAGTTPAGTPMRRYEPQDSVVAFLNSL